MPTRRTPNAPSRPSRIPSSPPLVTRSTSRAEGAGEAWPGRRGRGPGSTGRRGSPARRWACDPDGTSGHQPRCTGDVVVGRCSHDDRRCSRRTVPWTENRGGTATNAFECNDCKCRSPRRSGYRGSAPIPAGMTHNKTSLVRAQYGPLTPPDLSGGVSGFGALVALRWPHRPRPCCCE